jgi:hypothetical protein
MKKYNVGPTERDVSLYVSRRSGRRRLCRRAAPSSDDRFDLREFVQHLCAAARPHFVGPLPRISALTVASNLVAAYIVETQPGRTPGLAQEKQQVLAEAHAMAVLLEAILLCAAGQDDLALQDLPQPLLQAFLPQLCGFWVTWADWVPYELGPGEELIVQ